ncbi:hypothetical protein C8Q80DRAFT_1196397 [Daedaleopsis nitida]|nr:hypothetical protein C8Q80DRAFT_1196397 [Daedaleopsis nitida]
MYPRANTALQAKPSSAFHAFSGRSTAFATTSPFATFQQAPIWSTSANTLNGSHDADTGSSPTRAFLESNPLAAASRSAAVQKVVTVTGEEDEEVVTELKGAKVFVKRGNRDFCEGILGNVKLLKHKETGAERILFRREPVWKVTMSVRLRPTVRCLFDETQGALRVTLKEPLEDTLEEQLVVYALRRGKSSRMEFADFAEAILESARSQEQSRA